MSTTKQELADWIEKALTFPNVIESPFRPLGRYHGDDRVDSNVLGLALIGKVRDTQKADELCSLRWSFAWPDGPWQYLVSLLGISQELALELQQYHFRHPVQEIIQKLREGEFYSEELGMSPEQMRKLDALRQHFDSLRVWREGLVNVDVDSQSQEAITELCKKVEQLLFQNYRRIERGHKI